MRLGYLVENLDEELIQQEWGYNQGYIIERRVLEEFGIRYVIGVYASIVADYILDKIKKLPGYNILKSKADKQSEICWKSSCPALSYKKFYTLRVYDFINDIPVTSGRFIRRLLNVKYNLWD